MFLPIVGGGYWLLSVKGWVTPSIVWLLIASILFYLSASPISLGILLPSILVDYVLARIMLRVDPDRILLRGVILSVGVLGNALFLAYFKYRDFVLDTINMIFLSHFHVAQLILPLGISFLVFQKIAFLIDVHSGQIKSFGVLDYLLFMLFYPRAIAGPIVRYQEVAPQFRERHPERASTDLMVSISLLSIGLFKKSIVADSIGLLVPGAFDTTDMSSLGIISPTFFDAWTGVLAFNLQLYFDFSGYSDMALGAARMVGIRLPANFNSPFKSRSVVEFWSRWHITLTRFLTSYIYTPLVVCLTRRRMRQGRDVLRRKQSSIGAIVTLVAFPTMVTMAVSGLWHGAAWTFVIWGLVHGFYLTVNQSFRVLGVRFWGDRRQYERLVDPIWLTLTLISVAFAQVFFRAPSVHAAIQTIRGLIGLNGISVIDARVLSAAGVSVPHMPIGALFPWVSFLWLTILCGVVLAMPNSLELLRDFDPSLDLQLKMPVEPALTSRAFDARHRGLERSPWSSKKIWWAVISFLRNIGMARIGFNALSATVVAFLGVLALMALSRSAGFVYGKF